MKLFESVAQLRLAHLKLGAKVSTKSYYEGVEGGSADYIVVAAGSGVDDGGSYITLANGLQARLVVSVDVNVKQFGGREGSEFDSAAAINNALLSSRNVVVNGDFYVSEPCRVQDKGSLYSTNREDSIRASDTFVGDFIVGSDSGIKLANVFGFKVDGRHTYGTIAGSPVKGVYFHNPTLTTDGGRAVVQDMYIIRTSGDAIQLRFEQNDSLILNNLVYQTMGSGIAVSGSGDVKVDGNNVGVTYYDGISSTATTQWGNNKCWFTAYDPSDVSIKREYASFRVGAPSSQCGALWSQDTQGYAAIFEGNAIGCRMDLVDENALGVGVVFDGVSKNKVSVSTRSRSSASSPVSVWQHNRCVRYRNGAINNKVNVVNVDEIIVADGSDVNSNETIIECSGEYLQTVYTSPINSDKYSSAFFDGASLDANAGASVSITAGTKGRLVDMYFLQSATGGQTVVFDSTIGGSPTVDTTPNAETSIRFVHNGRMWLAL